MSGADAIGLAVSMVAVLALSVGWSWRVLQYPGARAVCIVVPVVLLNGIVAAIAVAAWLEVL